ncbi:MAG TPA: hypothetical protein VFE07_14395 [Marmoricola sp.]|jgi:hypothetical protein|nr:hypothetical protein [Marmoricola sp.]
MTSRAERARRYAGRSPQRPRGRTFDRVGVAAGHAGAGAITPYLLVKVVWVLAAWVAPLRRALDGVVPSDVGEPKYVLLNLVTIVMASVAITLCLALARPWGARIPGGLIAFGAWIGAGFLVSMLPFVVLSSALDVAGGGEPSNASSMPAWEGDLIQLSFGAFGLCLAVALPAYVRRRWPALGLARSAGGSGARASVGRAVLWPVLLAGATATVWSYWAAGGSAGLGEVADTTGRLLMGILAAWALVAVAIAARARVRPVGPGAAGAAFVATGALVAWCAWRLPFVALAAVHRPASDGGLPATLGAFAATQVAGLIAGLAIAQSMRGRHDGPRRGPRTLARPAPARRWR